MDITKNAEKSGSPVGEKSAVKTKTDKKCFEKYQLYFEPIVVTDCNFKILYKNTAAKADIPKLRTGNNIKKFLFSESLKKLQATAEKGADAIIDTTLDTPFSCAMAMADEIRFYAEATAKFKTERVIAFIFFAAINLFRQDAYREKAETILSMYGKEILDASKSVGHSVNELGATLQKFEAESGKKSVMSATNQKHVKFILNGTRKSTWMLMIFNAYIENSREYYDDTKKVHREMFDFVGSLNENISDYIRLIGYEVKFKKGDELFVAEINEKDFFLMNVILILISLRYSRHRSVNHEFAIDEKIKSGVARYSFSVSPDFFDLFRNRLDINYSNNRKGITDYLDLHIVALIAENNNSRFSIKSDAKKNEIIFEIIMNRKESLQSTDGLALRSGDYYTANGDIQNMLKAAFYYFSLDEEL